MTLLSDLPKLRELEQKATPLHWDCISRNKYGTITREDADFVVALRNAAPAMLAVLSGIHEGDANVINTAKVILKHAGVDKDSIMMETFDRLEKACWLMEGKGDEHRNP